MAGAVFDVDTLNKFKREYALNGPQSIEKQTPYLAELARYYEKKGESDPRNNWTDILKAHTLYNSCFVRDPSGSWKEDVFRVQQLYWGKAVQTANQEQTQITEELISKLTSIREQCKRCLKSPAQEIEKWESDIMELSKMADEDIHSETSVFVKQMKIVSDICNKQMVGFARRCVEAAIQQCGESPRTFSVVSLGSMARGEVTPHSDWEFLFLVGEKTTETIHYFEMLAMTCYFIVGNLCETKLKYMNIAELNGWYEDGAKSGFKIDGLQEGAGNIPTGNGSASHERNRFILTLPEIKELYEKVSNEPVKEEALKGDVSAMLESTSFIYGDENLLVDFETFRKKIIPNQERMLATLAMIEQDLWKYEGAVQDPRLMDIKKEVHRYPTLFIFNMKILFRQLVASSNSWDVIKELHSISALHLKLESSLKLMLSVAIFIRLSMYLHHDSQTNQLLFEIEVPESGETDQWVLPFPLLLYWGMHVVAVQEKTVVPDGDPTDSRLVECLCSTAHLDPISVGVMLLTVSKRYKESDKYLVQSIQSYVCYEDVPIKLKFLNMFRLSRERKYHETIKSAIDCLRTEEATDKQNKMLIENTLCKAYLQIGKKQECAAHAKRYSRDYIMEMCNMTNVIKIEQLISWAAINLHIDREEEAESMYLAALELLKTTKSFSLSLQCNFQLMNLYYNRVASSAEDRLTYCTRAEELALGLLITIDHSKCHEDYEISAIRIQAHAVLLEINNAADKLEAVLKHGYSLIAYLKLTSIPDNKPLTLVHKQVGQIHIKRNEYDKAIQNLEPAYRALKLMKHSLADPPEWCDRELEQVTTDMIRCHLVLGRSLKAVESHVESIIAELSVQMKSEDNTPELDARREIEIAKALSRSLKLQAPTSNKDMAERQPGQIEAEPSQSDK